MEVRAQQAFSHCGILSFCLAITVLNCYLYLYLGIVHLEGQMKIKCL